MRRFFFLSAFLLCAIAAVSPGTRAAPADSNPALQKDTLQETPPGDPGEAASTAPEKEKIPDEYIEEADRFLKSCDQDYTMRQFHNCDCMASLYLDRRIAMPKASSALILYDLKDECVDEAQIAGEKYESCINGAPMIRINTSLEDYCECFANTYVDMFKSYGAAMTSRVLVDVETQAATACFNPRPAKKP